MATEGLTRKQARFVELYLLSLNASQAALGAGYSPKTAPFIGAENLRKPLIKAAIEAAGQKLSERTGIDQQKLIDEWSKIAFTDLRDYMRWGPDGATLKKVEELTPAQRAAVAEVSQTITKEGGTIRLKLHDKQKALSELAARFWPAVQHTLDETPRQDYFAGMSDEEVRGVIEMVRTLKGNPGLFQELLRAAKARTEPVEGEKQEVKG